ncbi:MAG: T9SS type A sorting domain-containing protein, partial [Candidatus Cloacimonadaceae bacterium]
CGWFSGIMRFGSSLMIDSGNDSDLDMFIAKINTSTSADDMVMPFSTQAVRAYPNPFSDRISITVDKSQTGEEKSTLLNIYNVKGERVNRLALSRRDENSLQTEWNGISEKGLRCPAGVYFLKLGGSDSGAAKILLLN